MPVCWALVEAYVVTLIDEERYRLVRNGLSQARVADGLEVFLSELRRGLLDVIDTAERTKS